MGNGSSIEDMWRRYAIDETACPSDWDAVDEAVHRAFSSGATADPRRRLDPAELIAGIEDTPTFKGLKAPEVPQVPCRGLARLECLTPRPFYMPAPEQPTNAAAKSPSRGGYEGAGS